MGPLPTEERPRGSPAPPRATALALVAALLAPALAGCLSRGDPELTAQQVVKIERAPVGDFAPDPAPATPASPSRPDTADPSPDPRLNLTKPWGRGDRWYYESNRSTWMKMHVLGAYAVGNVPHYLLRTQYGKIGEPALATITSVVTREFETVNQTTPTGEERFSPAKPGYRFLPRDGSYSFNSTIVLHKNGLGQRFVNSVHVVEEWPLYPVNVPAGRFNASYFSVFAARVPIDDKGKFGDLQRLPVTERWYSPELGNDVMLRTNIDTEEEEDYQLVYAIVYGKLSGYRVEYEK